ncbi:MAG: peptidase, zinc-dependent [Bacteroidetes bacterium]|nr:peptidase, zinc-dependent [Bacteroidota bacterium]
MNAIYLLPLGSADRSIIAALGPQLERRFRASVAVHEKAVPIDSFTYVFGEAQLGGSVGVVSYYRLPNERYGLPANRTLFTERLLKEAMHELGHTFGLLHCRALDCAMHISTYVEDIDTKPAEFCRECEQKLILAESKP